MTPLDYSSAIGGVIQDLDEGRIDTSWSDSADVPDDSEGLVRLEPARVVIIERRRHTVSAAPADVYRSLSSIGGARGWFFANWTWRLRGMADRLLGGTGLRRGRRHPDDLRVGDAVDFWRVEALEENRLIRLKAEMKLPGRAWLQYEIRETPNGTSQLEQTAAFIPKGLPGLALLVRPVPHPCLDLQRPNQGNRPPRRSAVGLAHAHQTRRGRFETCPYRNYVTRAPLFRGAASYESSGLGAVKLPLLNHTPAGMSDGR